MRTLSAAPRKPPPNCEDSECPRQDSNLPHRSAIIAAQRGCQGQREILAESTRVPAEWVRSVGGSHRA